MAYDVVIVGGGVMGCAIAYHLVRSDSATSVVVVERDSTYEFSSTLRSEGNVRVQFNLEENIRMSLHAFEVLETFADDFSVGEFHPDVSARHQGNLFFVDAENELSAREGMDVQLQLGGEVVWMVSDEIEEMYPPLRNVGLVGGTFGIRDGAVDPSAVLQGYRKKSIALGVEFIEGTVKLVTADNARVSGVELDSGERLAAPVVVNAAGAWAAQLARTVEVDLPVQPVMRSAYTVAARLDFDGPLPHFFLPSGLYASAEGDGAFVIGWSLPSDPVGFDFTFSRDRFDHTLWPELVAHLPAFDQLKVTGGWAGLYAVNTLDGNAILGEWPELSGFYLASGFSGHGFQQCHAVGRYLAELILDRPLSFDLSRLGPQRILEGRPLYENAARII